MNLLHGSMSAGPSGIHNQMVSHLPRAGKEFLLSMSSCIWSENSVLFAWIEAVVIPILKHSKNPSIVTGCSSIRLASYVYRTWSKLLSCLGPGEYKSSDLSVWVPMSHVHAWPSVNFEHHIQNSFLMCEHLFHVLLDLEKAYNTAWWCHNLRIFYGWNFPLSLSAFSRIVISSQ
jgi:hypothetical protein